MLGGPINPSALPAAEESASGGNRNGGGGQPPDRPFGCGNSGTPPPFRPDAHQARMASVFGAPGGDGSGG